MTKLLIIVVCSIIVICSSFEVSTLLGDQLPFELRTFVQNHRKLNFTAEVPIKWTSLRKDKSKDEWSYSSTDKTIYLPNIIDDPNFNASLIYQYVHALHDQNFDIRKMLKGSTDTELAINCLLEGDAVLIRKWYSKSSIILDESMDDRLSSIWYELWVDPTIKWRKGVVEWLIQQKGENFVTTLLRVGGVDLLNTAFLHNPPRSTEQILHPQRYLSGDNPIIVDINLQSLGIHKENIVQDTVLGEFFLRVWLNRNSFDENLANGWGGDRYIIYKLDDQEEARMMVWEIVFDTSIDHTNFIQKILKQLVGSTVPCWENLSRYTYMIYCIQEINGFIPRIRITGESINYNNFISSRFPQLFPL